MPLQIDPKLSVHALIPAVERMFELSAQKILKLDRRWDRKAGSPVFTAAGRYTTRGWTEWTEGFCYGSALLQYDATGERRFLRLGQERTLDRMPTHVSHIGVHDHGFNNVSTYGNLRRLILEGRISNTTGLLEQCELALKLSGAIQASRWTQLPEGHGYIYSFNGPHSLFIDTMRSLRSLAIAHQLGHSLMGERDQRVNLLHRLLQHAETTRRYACYFGTGRDAYDLPGRVAHESIFNLNDGSYRCPNSQQGFSPFTTWTRGLAWALLGFAEEAEFLIEWRKKHPSDITNATVQSFLQTASATAERYLEEACTDGIPVWDTGAPQLHRLGDYRSKPSDPWNRWEPMDSSAAAIAAQGFWRLARALQIGSKTATKAQRYRQAALTISRTLLEPPYLSEHPHHEGLLLHSIYHRPNGWDYQAPRQQIPNGESSQWGDYHLREMGLILLREERGHAPYRFC